MALKLTVRMGGASGASTVNYTSQLRLWDVSDTGSHTPLLDAGMKSENGAASQFQFVLDDDSNEIPKADLTKNLPAHTVVTVSEDAPGYEAWLARGRIADKEAYRGDLEMGDAIAWSVTADDANVDVRGLTLTSPWVRTAESGRARLLALLAAFCNGSPRPSTVISTDLVASGGEVTMPAKTYPAGTELTEIIDDCATTEGKIWAVVIHHVSSASHLCFQYQDEADHTNYLSTLSITDTSPNLTTSFPPIWDQGAAKIEEGQELATGVVLTYGPDNYVVDLDSADADSYDYWVVPVNDSFSETAAQAASRAEAIREAKSREHVTHQVTIQLRANQVDLLCAGMSINIRSAASMGGQYLGTTQTRRIAQLKWEPIAPEVGAVDGYYLAHMQLDRPVRLVAAGKGTAPIFNPVCSTFAAIASLGANATNDGANYDAGVVTGPKVERVALTLSRNASVGQSIVAIGVHGTDTVRDKAIWDDRGNTYTLTANHRGVGGGDEPEVSIFYTNVSTELQAGDKLYYEVDVGSSLVASLEEGCKAISAYLFDGTLSAGAESGTGANINSAAPAVTVGSGGLIVAAGDQNQGASGTPDVVTDDAAWTSFTQAQNDSTATRCFLFGGFRIGDNDGQTWTGAIDQTRNWAMVGATFTTSGGNCVEPAAIGDTDSADGGTSEAAAREDHVHPHGNLTTGGPYHMAEDVTVADAGGYYTGTTVEAALQEVGADIAGIQSPTVTSHGNMGATETFDASVSSDHEGTQDANLTVTLTGATAGTASYLTLVLTQDATGGRTLTLPASVVTKSDVEAAWDTTASAVNILTLFTYDGGSTWYGFLAGGSSTAADIRDAGYWSPLTNGDATTPELVFADGDTISVWTET